MKLAIECLDFRISNLLFQKDIRKYYYITTKHYEISLSIIYSQGDFTCRMLNELKFRLRGALLIFFISLSETSARLSTYLFENTKMTLGPYRQTYGLTNGHMRWPNYLGITIFIAISISSLLVLVPK